MQIVKSMFLTKNFAKYLVIGGLLTVISTAALVILVDYMKIWVGYANPLIVAVIFLLRYILFDKAGMLNK